MDSAPPAPIQEIASAFESVASEAVEQRGRAPLVARGGKARLLKTESGRTVTHGEVMAGLLAHAGIETAVVDGVKPDYVVCANCPMLIKVPRRGGVAKTCKPCSRLLSARFKCGCGGRKHHQAKTCLSCKRKAAAEEKKKLRTCVCGNQKKPVSNTCVECMRKSRKPTDRFCACGKKVVNRNYSMCKSCGLRKWIADHPDEAKKIAVARGLASSAKKRASLEKAQ